MPFSNLNSAWSDLARYYNTLNSNGSFIGGLNNPNVTNSIKPQQPKPSEQYKMFDDGLIRGGILNAALATKNDVLSIGKFLYTSAKGPLFIIKQIGLHLSNPLLEQKANKTVTTDAAGNKVTTYTKRKDKLGLLPTRIYNGGINTLLSVGGNAFGLHFPKFGLLPTANYDYAKIAKENNNNSIIDNSSVSSVSPPDINVTPFNSIKSLDNVTVTGNRKKNSKKIPSPYTNKPNRLISYLGLLIDNDTSTNPVTLQSYLGGPDSVYGLINTRIRTTGDNITNKDSKLLNGFLPLSYRQIYNIGTELRDNSNSSHINYYYGPGVKETTSVKTTTSVQPVSVNPDVFPFGSPPDFTQVQTQTLETKTLNVNTKAYIPLEYTYGVSHSGKKGNFYNSVDSINAIKILGSKTFYDNTTKVASDVLSDYSNDGIEQTSIFGKDIIKFRIEILNNNNPIYGGVVNTEVYAFRAYINELNDGIDAKWEPYRYMGRGEEFYIYNGFTRDINVGFTVFAHSKPEMSIIYQKVNNLMSSFTPDYSNAGLMRGNVGYLTIGDYLYRTPGVFTSMRIGNLLETHWETNIDGDTYELPKLMNITLSFKPIHSFVPRRNYANKETAAFITPDIATYTDKGIADVSEITGDNPTTTYTNRFMPSIQKTTKTQ